MALPAIQAPRPPARQPGAAQQRQRSSSCLQERHSVRRGAWHSGQHGPQQAAQHGPQRRPQHAAQHSTAHQLVAGGLHLGGRLVVDGQVLGKAGGNREGALSREASAWVGWQSASMSSMDRAWEKGVGGNRERRSAGKLLIEVLALGSPPNTAGTTCARAQPDTPPAHPKPHPNRAGRQPTLNPGPPWSPPARSTTCRPCR